MQMRLKTVSIGQMMNEFIRNRIEDCNETPRSQYILNLKALIPDVPNSQTLSFLIFLFKSFIIVAGKNSHRQLFLHLRKISILYVIRDDLQVLPLDTPIFNPRNPNVYNIDEPIPTIISNNHQLELVMQVGLHVSLQKIGSNR